MAFHKLSTVSEEAKNTLGMPIKITYVKMDGETIGEFRNERWAAFFAQKIFEEGVFDPPEQKTIKEAAI